MDSHHAIIVGKENMEDEEFVALGTVDNPGSTGNSNENAANKQEIDLTHKFFKEIAAIMLNVDEVHVTGGRFRNNSSISLPTRPGTKMPCLRPAPQIKCQRIS